jgi:hypothetical protein
MIIFNYLKADIHLNYTFSRSATTLQRTQSTCFSKTRHLILSRKMNTVYCERHAKHINNFYGKMLKYFSSGTYSYHRS